MWISFGCQFLDDGVETYVTVSDGDLLEALKKANKQKSNEISPFSSRTNVSDIDKRENKN